jgi:thiol-disulfide isomerase/thioredoxin
VAGKLLVMVVLVACLGIGGYKYMHPTADAAANGGSASGVASVGTGGIVHLFGQDLVTSRPLDLDAYAGRPLIINVWASWCEACRVEGPEFAKFERARPDVLVIGLNMQDSSGPALAAMREWGWTHSSIIDREGRLFGALPRHEGIPMTFFLDSQHRVVDTILSNVAVDQLQAGARRITGA